MKGYIAENTLVTVGFATNVLFRIQYALLDIRYVKSVYMFNEKQ